MPDGTGGTDGAAVAKCHRCGEAEGTGLACALCAQVRIARNQPKTDDTWTTRTGKQPAMDGITNLLPGSKEKETTMRLPMRKPGEPLPPLRRATEEPAGARRVGRPRGTGHRSESKCPDCGAKVSGPWRCRKCSGLARRGKKIARLAGASALGHRGPVPGTAIAPISSHAVEVTRPAPATPATLPAEAPGPLTLAVCNFFGEVARASDHIEARMTLDRRKLSITVELALP